MTTFAYFTADTIEELERVIYERGARIVMAFYGPDGTVRALAEFQEDETLK